MKWRSYSFKPRRRTYFKQEDELWKHKSLPPTPFKEETIESPYLAGMISHQRPKPPEISLHIHLDQISKLTKQIFINHNPPLLFCLQTLSHLTHEILDSSFITP